MSKTNQESNQEITDINKTETKKKKESVILSTVEKMTKSSKKKDEAPKTEKKKSVKEDNSVLPKNSDNSVSKDNSSEVVKTTTKKVDDKKKTDKKKAEEEKKAAEKRAKEKKAEEKKAKEQKAKEKKDEEKKAKEQKEKEKKAEEKKSKEQKAKEKKVDTVKEEATSAVVDAISEEPIKNEPKTEKKSSKSDVKKEKAVKEESKTKDKKDNTNTAESQKEKKISQKDENKKEKPKKENDKPEKKKVDNKSKKSSDTKKGEKNDGKSGKKSEKWSIKQLGGYLFAKMLRGGASELHANAEEVNKLNVFPVPDGDTGDNMSMTIESGVASLDNIDTDDLAEVLKVASRGMLLGARGNSGVILSQFFAGMAKGLENVETADAKKLAHALEIGVKQAYTSVMTPTEGTILTVAREAVEYAVRRVNSKSTVQSLFSDLVKEMNASLERTPEILPILGEAGVVDSGGAGLLYIIDGLNRVLNGEDVEDKEISDLPKPKAGPVDSSSFGPDSQMNFGYCTELLVQLMNRKMVDNPFDLDALKLYLANYGDSIVAFQTESIVKIHVHTLRPDKILRYMLKFGDFISVKVENMSLQHTELKADEETTKPEEAPKKKYGIVAVSNGSGISDLFRELGTDQIVEGGQTNNPSTNDFIAAFDKINAESIFVFPNNGNIIMAAGQAAEIYEKAKVYVVPTKSIGAGYVAMSTMSFDISEPDELLAEAEDAIGRITSAYISPAVRDADMNGVHVTEGDTMGIIAKEIVISGPDKMVSTYGLIDIMFADENKFMITAFYGKDATSEEREQLESYMQKTYPHVEAYFVDGGQEIYPFLFVVE